MSERLNVLTLRQMQAFTSQNLGTLGIWKYKETYYLSEHAGMDSALRHGAFRVVGLSQTAKAARS